MAMEGEAIVVKHTKKPAESKLARFIDTQIDLLKGEKTQADIASELGYPKPNIITMFKQGLTRVPVNKIGPLARALGVDPSRMMRMALEEYAPETWQAIVQCLGEPITQNELVIVKHLRKLTNNNDYELAKADEEEALKNFATVLKKNNPTRVRH